ncbi:MAG: 3D-(3,5/4)-trihydroxycyclohexane-1,2-dione acylhydrolase (decyclizing) [Pseudomonadota bacterium]
MSTVRLTAAQALVRYLSAQMNDNGDRIFAGVWAIFGHGNVAGLGEALHGARDTLPTWRGHNEQTMAHAALAYAKQSRRKRMMAVTSSIGPGATNMVTAAATAHVNRLPILFLPGDVFASRGPDPVLQQVEDFADATVSANDCFRPVSRYFDRILRPEHVLTALPRALRTLTDPADCGPVTLAFCQDTQAEAYDYPESFFAKRTWTTRRPHPDPAEIEAAAALIRAASNPVIVAGGGIHYSGAHEALDALSTKHGIPVVETQAGKSALGWRHPMNFGPVGVTGATSANEICANADVVIGVGTRFQDFTTGSWSLFKRPGRALVSLNVQPYDTMKHGAVPVCADARVGLEAMAEALDGWSANPPPQELRSIWFADADLVTRAPDPDSNALPTDMQVIGAVQRASTAKTAVMCAAGTMPGELHKLWKAENPGHYHMEYGFSCMGYEIAGAMGLKMADPDRDVICMLGDGSYMMANSELATAVMMGIDFTIVITDNRGFGCINRLQLGTGGAEFNNLLDTALHEVPSNIDFAAHAASMGADAVKIKTIAELETALAARGGAGVRVIVVDTDPYPSTEAGGTWWDVAVPEVSVRAEVRGARSAYETALKDKAL